ncbi:ClpP/crotonase-like domain-containing protein [Fusarium acuminatum]|uniref:ClpP/crotonase-like domain-containing protein n=1 Tax=Fusarium acuminatum TaxID=5515 RepID=A0ABZ2XAV9_9HYPO
MTNTALGTRPPGTPTMKILFLCTAHNSLSQRLYLNLSQRHAVTVEYALSDEAMMEAASLVQPDIIICPFLTSRVPSEIFSNYLTLIVHPGPSGDAGPSALDWVLMGDDGTVSESDKLLKSQSWSQTGRSHWGVTVLQAVSEMDAGPVWAFEQFKIDIDASGTTKSTLYRGRVTQAAITATLTALNRIASAASGCSDPNVTTALSRLSLLQTPDVRGISVHLLPNPMYKALSVTQRKPFLGGATHRRPLLKAADRNFDVQHESARIISRKIRSADSQPGCLTTLFGGVSLYVYGGTIEAGGDSYCKHEPGQVIGCRDDAVCVATCDGLGIWITHIRRMKRKVDSMLWPKVPAVSGLLDLGLVDQSILNSTGSLRPIIGWSKATYPTHQDIWVDFASSAGKHHVAFVYFAFYNGAMSTTQCSRLLEALDFVASHKFLDAVVLMGGDSYFSNGIALNVIEASCDPSAESWRNINRIDDVVHMLLDVFPRKNVTTIAAMRGNCAAGGVALAAACDVVIAGSESVLNPAYRALGLHGSEYHSLSYIGRCGPENSNRILRDMLPISAYQAREMGLVDHVLPGSGAILDIRIRYHVRGMTYTPYKSGNWKYQVDLSPPGLASARAHELNEMAKDFWSARSERYASRRRDFVRKVKPTKTPLRFASHRRRDGEIDEEEADSFDDVAVYEEKVLQRIIGESELDEILILLCTVGSRPK